MCFYLLLLAPNIISILRKFLIYRKMDDKGKYLARILFKLKIHETEGKSFEDLFAHIMNYSEPDFQRIKPWGSIGDRKNDGYIPSQGIYFQVYAPEDIRKSLGNAIKKLESDFAGLLEKWKEIKAYYFVINDKYHGVPAHLLQAIQKIANDHEIKAEVWGVNKLEDLVFSSLDDDQILSITGSFPNPEEIHLDYSVLDEVITHLMKIDISDIQDGDIKYPNWGEKIEFNGLSEAVKRYLEQGFLHVAELDECLDNNSNFFAEQVKDRVREIYINKAREFSGDKLFMKIMNTISHRQEQLFQFAAIIIMAKYFEICDIFKKPE